MLPQRTTGLKTGTARERGYPPLTESQRAKRHAGIFGSTTKIEDILPALPPDLPLPKFLVEQMKKK